MQTFLIGLVILIGGGALYGGFCQKVFGPDDRQTPAYERQDGVDFVPMPKWKNALINLLNIAGTGPILGPIQGILFGPIAFITIPVGCVIGGAMHDPLAAFASYDPSIITNWFSCNLTVEETGRTIASFEELNLPEKRHRVALDVDTERFTKEYIRLVTELIEK